MFSLVLLQLRLDGASREFFAFGVLPGTFEIRSLQSGGGGDCLI